MHEYEVQYEVQYLDNTGEPAGYDTAPNIDAAVRKAKKTLRRFLSPYELRYALILGTHVGDSISAYRTTPEGIIKQIGIEEVPV